MLSAQTGAVHRVGQLCCLGLFVGCIAAAAVRPEPGYGPVADYHLLAAAGEAVYFDIVIRRAAGVDTNWLLWVVAVGVIQLFFQLRQLVELVCLIADGPHDFAFQNCFDQLHDQADILRGRDMGDPVALVVTQQRGDLGITEYQGDDPGAGTQELLQLCQAKR